MSSTLFTIEHPSGIWYALFYFVAFSTALIILVVEGKKRQFPTVPWLLVISTSFLFFIIGTQAIKFTSDDWVAVMALKIIDHNPGRSVLGGILLGTIGLLLAKFLFEFRHDAVDTFAWVMPVGMLIQRVGCLFTGCCYGTTTDLPWGVVYGKSSYAFHHQVQTMLSTSLTKGALPVHPVPLYEIAGCLFIIFTLAIVRKKISTSGNLFLTMLALYGVARFVTEFFRAESFGEVHPGLNTVQWIILFVVPFLSVWVIWREKKKPAAMNIYRSVEHLTWRSLVYFSLISIVFLVSSRWLSMLEIMTLNLVLVPTLILISWCVFKSVTVPRMRIATCVMLIGSLLLMSQTLPEKTSSDSTKTSYNEVSFGLSGGSIDFNRIYYQTVAGSGCNGSSSVKVNDVLHSSNSVFGTGFTRVVKKKSKTLQYGADFYTGSMAESYTNSQGVNQSEVTNHVSIAGFHPYVQYDGRDAGVGMGLHAGSLAFAQLPNDGSGNPTTTSISKVNLFPSFYFRVGRLGRFFWENKLGQQFPAPFPGLAFQTNFGIGFPTKKIGRSVFRFGTASYVGFFIAPSFSIDNVIVEPYLGGGPGIFLGKSWGGNYSDISQKASMQAAISVRFKFGRREKSLK